MPAPNNFSTDPAMVGTNIVLAMIVLIVILLTSTLFNQTVQENSAEIEDYASRLLAPLRPLVGLVRNGWTLVSQGRPWVGAVVGPVVILVPIGLIYGFLEPNFGFNAKSLVLFLSLLLGLGAITYVYGGGQALLTNRRFHVPAGVRLYPVALAIAAVSVALSRLVDFQPGVVYGFVASYAVLAAANLDRRQSGQIVLFPALALLALSLIAWLLVIPLRDVSEDRNDWWAAFAEGAAVAIFIGGLEGLFFNLIPITFMDGTKIFQWNRLLWFLVFGSTGFLFWHVLLNREKAYFDALQEGPVIMMLSLLAVCFTITLVTWTYFRIRVYGWVTPSWRRR